MTGWIKSASKLKITLTKNGGKQSILGRALRLCVQSLAKACRRRRFGMEKSNL